ncbi:hypothetical protein EYF80_068357 [Liparis tanakae]|uniref:Uncharacterized protein n=1 Tax=Liparis tanakae TaxID=230148 RepID=A0A4Z2DZF5_9TELE|nr:hypothetical protein EYF80_068357 [Liparis tanakae]
MILCYYHFRDFLITVIGEEEKKEKKENENPHVCVLECLGNAGAPGSSASNARPPFTDRCSVSFSETRHMLRGVAGSRPRYAI